jgi:hypothetical protein
MNQRQINKSKMYGTVGVVLNANTDKINTIPALPPEVEKFKNYIGAISIKTGEQNTSPAGKVDARDNAKAVLTKALFVIMKGTKLLAQKNNDSELLALSNLPLSDIERMKDIELRDKSKLFLTKTTTVKEALAEFGITDERLTAFSSAIDSFTAAMDDLAGGETGRIAATTTLANLFKETDSVLLKIDDFVNILDDTYPEFGLQYKAARNIKDLGGSHKDDNDNKDTGTNTSSGTTPTGTN